MKKMYLLLTAFVALIATNVSGQNRVEEDFDLSLTPTGWTSPLNQGTLISRVTTVQSFGRSGTVASVMCDGYNVAAGNRAQLETPTFTAITAGDSLRFDVAAAAYTANAPDSMIIFAFNGTSYTRIIGWGVEQAINLNGITTAAAMAPAFTPTASQWIEKAIALPIGTTRVRFEFYSEFSNRIYLDRVRVDGSMIYNSTTTTQNNTNTVVPGSTNQEIVGIQVNVAGSRAPFNVTSFSFNTTGSTNAIGDIDSAKVFYSGNSSSFSTATRFGQVPAPNGVFTITGNQQLSSGINYFWLVYDIKPSATLGNTLDAQCNSVTVGGTPRTPLVTNPAGSRLISTPPVAITASLGSASAQYNTLKDAFDNINNGTHQGVINVSINGNTTESAVAILRRSGVGASNYTKVIVKPTVNATIQGNINGPVVHLRGAQNVTIDGRIGTNPSNSLTIQNNSLLTNTVAVQISTLGAGLGARFDTIMHCNIRAGRHDGGTASNTFGIYIADSTISSTGTGNGNSYIGIVNNDIARCRYGIFNRGVTPIASNNKSIFISGNTIGNSNAALNVSFVGIDCQQNDSLVVADNKITDMFESAQTVIVRAIDLGANITNSKIERNYINNIRNTTTTLFRSGQGIFLSTIQGSNNLIANNVILNLNGHGSGTLANNAWGIILSAGGGVNILHNTIAFTGSATTTGSSDLSGCLLLTSSLSTAVVVRGNIFFNTRQPGNNVGGFSMCVHSTATAANVTFNNNIYYVTPLNARFITGVIAAVNRANFAAWQTGTTQDVNSTDANPLLATTIAGKGRIGPGSPAIGAGPTGSVVTLDIEGNTRGATPTIGAYENSTIITDLQPTNVYTLGRLPIPYANPHTPRARVFNLGNVTSSGSKAYLTIRGANSIIDSISLPNIAPGQSVTVDMPSINYNNTGVDTMLISVEGDSNNFNNSINLVQVINTNTYSYAEPFLPAVGGVGFNGATGDFVAKFPYTGSNSINQIGVNFSAGGNTLSIGIWDTSATGTPGTNLWTSAPFNSVTGLNTIVVNPPVPINGTFFVGVRQTGTTNASFSYQTESPIRPQTFYFTSPTGSTTWNDFAPNNPFRFMIEPRLQEADDIGPTSVILPCANVIVGSSPINPQVEIFNFGALSQSSYIVKTLITGPVSFSSTDTVNSTLLSSQSNVVNINNAFNPTVVGNYTMKVWTELAADLQQGNDTLVYEFAVSNVDLATNAGNQLNFDGSTQYGTANGRGNLNISGGMLTLEAWVSPLSFLGNRTILSKNQTNSISHYKLYINGSGNLVFKYANTFGVDSIISNTPLALGEYVHVAATYDYLAGFAKLFINGAQVGQALVSFPLISTLSPVYLASDNSGSLFVGRMDEVRIWDTARTTDQIRSNMHRRLATASHPNLKAYWRMDELSGLSSIDASGNCNAISLAGSPLFNASTLPLGNPVVAKDEVFTNGIINLPNVNSSIEVFNQVGTNEFYVHRFVGLPHGTLPSAIPGGVTATTLNNWVIYRYGAGTMDSSLVTFNVTGINASPLASDFIFFTRSNGGNSAWSINGSAYSADFTTQTVTGVFLSSQYNKQITIGANNNPLPVTILYFNGRNDNKDVHLNWATTSEVNNLGFELQRSVDGKTFERVAFVRGAGNSMEKMLYSYTDQSAFVKMSKQTLYYRLVQKDFSGKESVSDVVVVNSAKQAESGVFVYPNPFTDKFKVSIEATQPGEASIIVTDVAGSIIQQQTSKVNAGVNDLSEFSLQQLSSGIYFVRVIVNGETTVRKVMKQ